MENRLEFILKQAERADQFKRDEVLDFSKLRMNATGGIITVDDTFKAPYHMTEWAANQLCQRLGMPFRYYEICPPELRQTNVNYWMERAADMKKQAEEDAKQVTWKRGGKEILVPDGMSEELQKQAKNKNVMLRLREENDERVIRGILSDKYTKFDNSEILHLVNEFLTIQNKDYNVEMWNQNDDGFHLRLTFDALTTQIGYTPDGKPDIHKVGIHVMNSEVGRSSVRIIPMVYRQVCTNGLMAWVSDNENIFSQRHLYIAEETMRERVAVAIGNALKMGDATIDVLQKAKAKKVDNPYEIIDKLAKDKKYSKKFVEKVKDQYNAENDGSLFYVVQAFTDVAKTLPSQDARIDIERDAASLLKLVA